MKRWKIGMYIRLSVADRNQGKEESDSITNQRELIQRYIESHEDLSSCDRRVFYDDGITGTHFDRPGFEEMISEVKSRKIDCVIVKDFSRFGRDYIELGDYMEQIFPFLGVRFISINDGYDSIEYNGTTGGLDVVMKNIIYAYYSKDLSLKVITAKRSRMKRGEYGGGLPPYGYLRNPDDHHRLIIDPEAAEVVREIFDLTLRGKRKGEIARIMNAKGCDTPSLYYRRKHPETKKFQKVPSRNGWTLRTVRGILDNKVYYGAVVGHKVFRKEIGKANIACVPEEEQIIVENQHEGIVTKEEFEQAQTFRGKNEKYHRVRYDYPLQKKVRCGTCGRNCRVRILKPATNPTRQYACNYANNQVGEGRCSKDKVSEDVLKEAIWQSIRKLIRLANEAGEKEMDSLEPEDRKNSEIKIHMQELEKQKQRLEVRRLELAESYWMGDMSKEAFQKKKTSLNIKIEAVEQEIAVLEKDLMRMDPELTKKKLSMTQMIREFAGEEQLTDKMIDTFVDHIRIYDAKHIEIEWKIESAILKWLEEGNQ